MQRILQILLLGVFMIYCPGACAAAENEAEAKKNGMALIRLFESKQKKTNLAKVKKLLKKPTDFNCKGMYGYRVLACAIYHTDNPEIVDVLVKAGADVNGRIFPDRKSDTVLHIAALHNARPAIIDMLIRAGADVDARNDHDSTPLFYSLGNPKNTQLLINAGADVNARDSVNFTPLLHGVIRPYEPAYIEMLVKAGADVNARDYRNDSIAFVLAGGHNKDPEVLSELARLGADIHARNSSGRNALMEAAEYDNAAQIFRQLVKMGIDVNEKNETGKTALMYAVCHPVAFNTLIELGADAHVRDADGRNALLHAGLKAYFTSGTINTLIQAGLDINAADNFGKTALHYVAEANRMDPMEILVKMGADVGIRLENGKTVLMESVSDCWNFSKECLESILAARADVNACDNDGRTALMYAVYDYNRNAINESRIKNFIYVIDRLLKAGADKSIKDNSGKTAFDYAKEQRDLANTEGYRQLKPDF